MEKSSSNVSLKREHSKIVDANAPMDSDPVPKRVKTNDGTVASTNGETSVQFVRRMTTALPNPHTRIRRTDVCIGKDDIPCEFYVDWTMLVVNGKTQEISAKLTNKTAAFYELGYASTSGNEHYVVSVGYGGSSRAVRTRLGAHFTKANGHLSFCATKMDAVVANGHRIMYRCWVMNERMASFVESHMLFVFEYEWNVAANGTFIPQTTPASRGTTLTQIVKRRARHNAKDLIEKLEPCVATYGRSWAHIAELNQEFKSLGNTRLRAIWIKLRKVYPIRAKTAEEKGKTMAKEFTTRHGAGLWTKEQENVLIAWFITHGDKLEDWQSLVSVPSMSTILHHRTALTIRQHWVWMKENKSTSPSMTAAYAQRRNVGVFTSAEESKIEVSNSAIPIISWFRDVLQFVKRNVDSQREMRELLSKDYCDGLWTKIIDSCFPSKYQSVPTELTDKSGWYELGIGVDSVQPVYIGHTSKLRDRIVSYGAGNTVAHQARPVLQRLQGVITPVDPKLQPLDVWYRCQEMPLACAQWVEAVRLYLFDFAHNIISNGCARTYPEKYVPCSAIGKQRLVNVPRTYVMPLNGWNPEQITGIRDGVLKHGRCWSLIRSENMTLFGSRTSRQMRAIYESSERKAKAQSLNPNYHPRIPFTKEADLALITASKLYPRAWAKIKQYHPLLKNRNPICIRYRVDLLRKRGQL